MSYDSESDNGSDLDNLTESSSDNEFNAAQAELTAPVTRKKRRRRKGSCWWIWSCINNERIWIATFYSISLVLICAVLGLVVSNNQYPVVVNGTVGYVDVLFPPYGEFLDVGGIDTNFTCTVSDNMPDIRTFTSFYGEEGFSGGTTALIVFVSFYLLLGLPLLCFAWTDFALTVRYEEAQGHHIFALFVVVVGLFVMTMVIVLIMTLGALYYRRPNSCFPVVLTLLVGARPEIVVNPVTINSMVSAVGTASILSWIACVMCLINCMLYGAILCSPRTWYDMDGYNLRKQYNIEMNKV